MRERATDETFAFCVDKREAVLREIIDANGRLLQQMCYCKPEFTSDEIKAILEPMLQMISAICAVITQFDYDKKGPYKDYLRSERWQDVRVEILLRDKYCCVKCHSRNNLQVHHKTYERRGMEDKDDLMTLCESCHKKEHGLV